jgi:hypothetical protein
MSHFSTDRGIETFWEWVQGYECKQGTRFTAMRTVTMLKKLQELGFELKPDPEKLYKWVFEDMLEDRWSDNILTCGNDRDDLILETYEGIFLGKYRDSKD